MNRWVTSTAVGVGILVLAACSSHPATSTAAAPATSSAATTTTSAPKASPTLAKLGQPVQAGVYTFTVTKFRCGITSLGVTGNTSDGNGPGGLSVPLHGQFCVALVNELNVSHQPQPVPFSAQMLGTNGSSYDNDTADPAMLTNADIEYFGSNYTGQSEVNPGTVNRDVFVWDVPSDVRASTVTIDSGFVGSGSGTVNVST